MICGEDNSAEILEKRLYPIKVTVWCDFWLGDINGPSCLILSSYCLKISVVYTTKRISNLVYLNKSNISKIAK